MEIDPRAKHKENGIHDHTPPIGSVRKEIAVTQFNY